jgi:hypothetical protein
MLNSAQLVDEYFIENRNRILEIAAFLDRLDRANAAEMATDFRMLALSEILNVLAGAAGSRVARIQEILSDPTTEPLPALDRKSARGAYDARPGEARP